MVRSALFAETWCCLLRLSVSLSLSLWRKPWKLGGRQLDAPSEGHSSGPDARRWYGVHTYIISSRHVESCFVRPASPCILLIPLINMLCFSLWTVFLLLFTIWYDLLSILRKKCLCLENTAKLLFTLLSFLDNHVLQGFFRTLRIWWPLSILYSASGFWRSSLSPFC